MKFVPVLSASVLAIAVAGNAAPGQELRPGIIGNDDRVILTEEGPPWDAVGQVNVGGYSMSGQCTGTLIAPNLVVTAAHCVVNPATRTPFPLHDIHFLAAVRGSDNKGHATAQCLHFLKSYPTIAKDAPPPKSGEKVPLSSLANDVVTVVLSSDIEVDPAPLAEKVVPEPGLELVHIAYPGDRRFMPVAHFGCHLLRAEGPFWFNDCDTHPGSSGGPLFVKTGGVYAVAAITIAAGDHGANVALPLSEWTELTGETGCP